MIIFGVDRLEAMDNREHGVRLSTVVRTYADFLRPWSKAEQLAAEAASSERDEQSNAAIISKLREEVASGTGLENARRQIFILLFHSEDVLDSDTTAGLLELAAQSGLTDEQVLSPFSSVRG